MSSFLPRLVTMTLIGLCLLSVAPAAHARPIPDHGTPVAGEASATRAPGHGFFRWPTVGRLTQEFGCTGFRLNRSRGHCQFFHNGLDIANRRGTPVVAAARGIVTHVGWDPFDRGRNRAWVVIVRHAGGIKSWYAHLQPRRVRWAKVGDTVRRGQLIGYMGRTGKATGVHLHFMARYDGRFVNPRRFLSSSRSKPPREFWPYRLKRMLEPPRRR